MAGYRPGGQQEEGGGMDLRRYIAALGRYKYLIIGLAALGLPTSAPPGHSGEELIAVMRRDKKAAGGLTFVLHGNDGLERVDDPEPAAVAKALAAVGVTCTS